MNLSLFCGIDVSADKLDICFIGDDISKKPIYNQILNNSESISSFFQSIDIKNVVICFECTGTYSFVLSKILNQFGFKYHELDPKKTSLFLKHLSSKKTDILDSYGLAVYCRTFHDSLVPDKFNSKFKLIQSYNTLLTLISKIKVQLKNFKHSRSFLDDEVLKSFCKDLLLTIDNYYKKLEDICYKLICIEIPQTEKIINSNIGYGKKLAICLFPFLNYNRSYNAKQIISFFGLAPKIYSSGSSVLKSPHITKLGNSNARQVLFLCAMVSARLNPYYKTKYEHLVTNNHRPKKVALVAVACAIIRHLKSYFKNEH